MGDHTDVLRFQDCVTEVGYARISAECPCSSTNCMIQISSGGYPFTINGKGNKRVMVAYPCNSF